MANKMAKNLNTMLADSRTRTILIFSGILVLIGVIVGIFSLRTVTTGPGATATLASTPGNIESVPFATEPTEQYVKLVEQRNVEQAKQAERRGGSAIPTIVRAKAFGEGEQIGPQAGEGGLGFAGLKQQTDFGGVQKDLWIKRLQDGNCAPAIMTDVINQGADISILKEACGCARLKASGFEAKELKSVCPCKALKASGFTALDLKQAGYTARQLRICGFDACQMRAAGFTAAQLHAAGYTDGELRGAGFSEAEIRGAAGLPDGITAEEVRQAGCGVRSLERLRQAGVTAMSIRRISGCSVSQLKAAGYPLKQLCAAGFSPAELLGAGFTSEQLNNTCQISEQVSQSAAMDALLEKGCDLEALKIARGAGVTAKAIREQLGCDPKLLREAGFTAADLKEAGYTAAELKAAGFSARQLKHAGFSAKELKDAGFNVNELKAAGFSASALKDAGFTAAQLRTAGFNAEALKAAGFSATELKAAGFDAKSLADAGFTETELKAAGFTPEQLAEAGFIEEKPVAEEKPKKTDDKDDQLQAVLAQQAERMSEQRLQQRISQRQAEMSSVANDIINALSAPVQTYAQGKEPEVSEDAGGVGTAGGLAGATPESTVPTRTLKAGAILFAVLETSVNSDEQGPVLASIVGGPYRGSKLIGMFNLPANAQKMTLVFTTMSIPGVEKSVPLNAVAIDPKTARTALASNVDNHYLLRYGTLFASSFMEGFGGAFQAAGTTITVGGAGTAGGTAAAQNTTSISQADRTLTENAVVGLAKVGQRWGTQIAPLFNRPPTVELYSGTTMGILINSDVEIPIAQR